MRLSERFRVEPGSHPKLRDFDPGFHGKHENRNAAAPETEKNMQRMRQLQYLLYADHRRSLLVVLQALDAGGKDGTISHVLDSMNPQGVRVAPFKAPTPYELAHDFLWRVHEQTPAKGELAIFNRSHYEDVLIARVHGLVRKKVWSRRYERINDFEKNLVQSGTSILKFYLHISEDEQLARFEQRLDDPMRHWKISEADYSERKLWPAYTKAFEAVFHKTSTAHAPWFIIPANHKWFRNLAVSTIIADTLDSLGLELPAPTVNIADIRRKYHAAVKAVPKKDRPTSRKRR